MKPCTQQAHRTIPSFLDHSSQRRPNVQLDPSAFLADPELIQALEKRATPFVCDEDRVLFRQGDLPTGLFIIHKGEATLSMNPGASENIFSCQATAGSVLGLPGPHRQPALLAHRRCPPRRASQLHRPRRLQRPHAIRAIPRAPQDPPGARRRSPLRPPALTQL